MNTLGTIKVSLSSHFVQLPFFCGTKKIIFWRNRIDCYWFLFYGHTHTHTHTLMYLFIYLYIYNLFSENHWVWYMECLFLSFFLIYLSHIKFCRLFFNCRRFTVFQWLAIMCVIWTIFCLFLCVYTQLQIWVSADSIYLYPHWRLPHLRTHQSISLHYCQHKPDPFQPISIVKQNSSSRLCECVVVDVFVCTYWLGWCCEVHLQL